MRAAIAVAVAVVLALPIGCGPDVRRERAERTVRLSSRALTRVEQTAGGDDGRAEIAEAHADAARWLAEAEEALDVWPSAGSMAFETMVPCLARALGRVRERLARHGRPIPETLREAEAQARSATDLRCARQGSAADRRP